MHFIESQISEHDKVLFWKRYLDDIFVISSVPLDTLLCRDNSVAESIKFTLELPDPNNTIPFLDVLVLLSNENVNSLLPLDSSVLLQRKRSLVYTEFLRAYRYGSNNIKKKYGADFIKRRFSANKYPPEMLINTTSRAISNRRLSNGRDKIYLKFLYVNEHHSQNTQTIISSIQINAYFYSAQ